MEEKKLAEKVAEKLGWRTYTWQEQCYVPEIKGFCVIDFKDWRIFGLMVEKAESMGWDFQCKQGLIYFIDWKTVSAGFPRETKEHGHIKACAMAFIEIPTNKPSANSGGQKLETKFFRGSKITQTEEKEG